MERRHRSYSPGDPPTYGYSEDESNWRQGNMRNGSRGMLGEEEEWNRDDVESFRVMLDEQPAAHQQGYNPFEVISDAVASGIKQLFEVSDPLTIGASTQSTPQRFRKPPGILTSPRSPRTKRMESKARGKCIKWRDQHELEELHNHFGGCPCSPQLPDDYGESDIRDESFYFEPNYFAAPPLHPTQIDGEHDPILSFRERKLAGKARARREAASPTNSEEDCSWDNNSETREDERRLREFNEDPDLSAIPWKEREERSRSEGYNKPQYAEIVWKSQSREMKKKRSFFGKTRKNKKSDKSEETPRSHTKTRKKSLYQA